MKTAEETLAEIVHNHFKSLPVQFKSDFQKGFGENWNVALKAMKQYANQVAKQALKDASENATNTYCNCYEPRYDCDSTCRSVDKESILETEIKTP